MKLIKVKLGLGKIPGNVSNVKSIFFNAGFDERVRNFLVQFFQYFREGSTDSRSWNIVCHFLTLRKAQLRKTTIPLQTTHCSAQVFQFQGTRK